MEKEDIIPLREYLKRYFIEAYFLCECNKTALAKKLGISIRTVKNYCLEFKLPARGAKLEDAPEPPVIDHYDPSFNCMQPVTQAQRDAWYNKDYY